MLVVVISWQVLSSCMCLSVNKYTHVTFALVWLRPDSYSTFTIPAANQPWHSAYWRYRLYLLFTSVWSAVAVLVLLSKR